MGAGGSAHRAVRVNKLPQAKQAAILKALTDGASIRATARMVGVRKTTVLRLLVDVGQLCAIYQDEKLRNLPCRRVEADEIWAFVGAKQRNAKRQGDGDIWTFTALDADTQTHGLLARRAAHPRERPFLYA